jgi:hypothetical protein
MIRWSGLAPLAIAFWASLPRAAELVELSIIRAGTPRDLAGAAGEEIATRVRSYFETCSLNSRDDPDIFQAWDGPAKWQETMAADHLRLSYDAAVPVRPTGAAMAEQFLIGLGHPDFPGPELTRHGNEIVGYAKCAGLAGIELVCTAGAREFIPETYTRLCQYLPTGE